LNLNSNFLSSKGAKLICEALLETKWLKVLIISDNGLDDTCAASFGKLLFESKVKELIISKNLFGPEGLGVIFDVIWTKNWSLKILDVAENTVNISLLHSLRQMIEVNPKLSFLSITGLYHFN